MTDMTDAKKGIMHETILYGVNDGDTTFYISLRKEKDSELGEVINRKIIYSDGSEGIFGAFLKSAEPFIMRTPSEELEIVIDPKTLDAYAVSNQGVSLAQHLMNGLIKDDSGFRKPKNYLEIAKYRGGTRLVPAFEHNTEK